MTDVPSTTDALRSRGEGRENGQMMVVTIGYVVVALLLATVVAAASAVYIEHKKLLSLADGASVAAADSYSLGQVGGAEKPSAVLSSERVRSVTGSYLSQNSAYSRFDQLAVGLDTGSPDNATAEVVLRAVAHPPVVGFLLAEGVPIEARSTARSRLTR